MIIKILICLLILIACWYIVYGIIYVCEKHYIKKKDKAEKVDKTGVKIFTFIILLFIILIGAIIYSDYRDKQDTKLWNNGKCAKCGCEWYYDSEKTSLFDVNYECKNGHKIKIEHYIQETKDIKDIKDLRNWNNGKCKTCNTNWHYRDSSERGFVFECDKGHFIVLKDLPNQD